MDYEERCEWSSNEGTGMVEITNNGMSEMQDEGCFSRLWFGE